MTGHPDDGSIAAAGINGVMEGMVASSRKGVHLCFDNYGGQTTQRGGYARLVPFLNALDADHVIRAPAGTPRSNVRRPLSTRLG